MSDEGSPNQRSEDGESADGNLLSVYGELCQSYHAIDDFRAKLLGFLPLASGAGIFFLVNSTITDPAKRVAFERAMTPIGAFGFVITIGLFAYEIYGIKKCGRLISAGKRLEGQLGVEGQFLSRPHGVAGRINEPFAAGIIYPAVLAAWIYVALVFALPQMAWLVALIVFLHGFVAMFFYDRWLDRDRPKED